MALYFFVAMSVLQPQPKEKQLLYTKRHAAVASPSALLACVSLFVLLFFGEGGGAG